MSSQEESIDLKELHTVVSNLAEIVHHHDRAVFELVASVNAMQEALVEKNFCSKEEIIKYTENQLNRLRENLMQAWKEKKELEEKQGG